jgi:hypothetical protein
LKHYLGEIFSIFFKKNFLIFDIKFSKIILFFLKFFLKINLKNLIIKVFIYKLFIKLIKYFINILLNYFLRKFLITNFIIFRIFLNKNNNLWFISVNYIKNIIN